MTDATGPADETPKNEAVNDSAINDSARNAAPENEAAKSEAAKPSGETGTSLATASEAPSGVDPFIAIAAEAPATAAEPRPLYARALDYSAHAAMVVGLIGFAWTVSDHVVAKHSAVATSGATTTPVKLADASTPASGIMTPAERPAAPKVDEMGDLRKSNQKMASEIRNLRASLEALRTTVVRERVAAGTPDEARGDLRALSASLDTLKSSLAGTKSEQSAAITQLTAKVEKLQREEKAPQPIVERKPERQQLDTATTASIPAAAAKEFAAKEFTAKSVPTPPAKPTVLASAEPDDVAKTQVISGWVVRDVYQGVALIEGRRGQMEVVPGVSIPGAGVVKSIARHDGAWTVTTTKGQFASAAAPQHEPRRSQRDYYGQRRWDF